MEQFGLPRGRLRPAVLPGGKALHLVEALQQEVLQTVFDDRIAEHVAAVTVGIGRHLKPDRSPLDDAMGRMGDRAFAQGVKERRFETKSCFGEKVPREGTESHLKIFRPIGEHQDRAGQQQHHRIAAHMPSVLVDRSIGTAAAAKKNRTSIGTAGVIAEKGEIGFADDKLLFGSSNYRINRRHIFLFSNKSNDYFDNNRTFVPKSTNTVRNIMAQMDLI